MKCTDCRRKADKSIGLGLRCMECSAPSDIYEAAYDKGYDDGYEAAYDKGYNAGYEAGYSEGMRDAMNMYRVICKGA